MSNPNKLDQHQTEQQTQAQQQAQPQLPGSTQFLMHLLDLVTNIQRIQKLSDKELAIVNQTTRLIQYDRALLVRFSPSCKLLAAKGCDNANHRQPVLAQRLELIQDLESVDANIVTEKHVSQAKQASFLSTTQGNHVFWIPIKLDEKAKASHGLWLERSQPWQAHEATLSLPLSPLYAVALQPRWTSNFQPRVFLLAAALIFALGFFPIPAKIVSTGHVRAQSPTYLTAQLTGIVANINVSSGEEVRKNQHLLSFDRRTLQRDIEEAEAEVGVAKAEHIRLRNSAFDDSQARAKMQLQFVEIERRQTRLKFLHQQTKYLHLYSPTAGVVQINHEEELIGKPVKIGERLAVLANPEKTEWVAEVSVQDIGYIEKGLEVEIYLDHDPLNPVQGTIRDVDFEVTLGLNQTPVIIAYIDWNDPENAQSPGEHGSMHLEAKDMPFWYAVFRKPLGNLYERFGFW
ncbi:MAG: efflux RND transporter periplasmic adaptor subunit [Mariprofundaceae bacterium]|nr:efflux RND transporter periplasmic adaptor subunit [Mariprofundaceae bacterium]